MANNDKLKEIAESVKKGIEGAASKLRQEGSTDKHYKVPSTIYKTPTTPTYSTPISRFMDNVPKGTFNASATTPISRFMDNVPKGTPYVPTVATPAGATTSSTEKESVVQPSLSEPLSAMTDVPAVNTKPYDPKKDYSQSMQSNINNGNVFGAMVDEYFRNQKIGDMGLGYTPSYMFNYNDTQGYGGLRDRKYKEIEDYYKDGFSYDYTNDPMYKNIKNLKENEADKAYKDMYAQYSSAFDGGVPVNMMNKLATTRSEIIDQADSYIPQLEQIAYEKYMDKGNQLYNQYNMLDATEREQYGRFYDNRNFMADAIANNYANGIDQRNYDRSVFESDRNYDYTVGRDKIEDARYADEMEYQKKLDQYYQYLDMADRYAMYNPWMGWPDIWDTVRAKQWY